MKSHRVKDLMVPLEEYATVNENASLFEAVFELEKIQAKSDPARYRHRAVLVLDDRGHVVGKVSQLDILRSLEPKYEEMQQRQGQHRPGFTRQFLKSLLDNYDLWQKPMDDICKKAVQRKVKEFMYTPPEGEFVDENASLDEAIHQLVMGHHQSLLVVRKNEIVGILRLSDVFVTVSDAIKQCPI